MTETSPLFVRVPTALHRRVKAYSAAYGLSIQDFVTSAIEAALQRPPDRSLAWTHYCNALAELHLKLSPEERTSLTEQALTEEEFFSFQSHEALKAAVLGRHGRDLFSEEK